MSKESISYCGLDCTKCKEKYRVIREKAADLEKSLIDVNFEEVSKVIPFMRSKYKGYKKFMTFFNSECPGCRDGGGNPFCKIRKCATKKGYNTCAECESLCKKFNSLFKVHIDNEIQNNMKELKNLKK